MPPDKTNNAHLFLIQKVPKTDITESDSSIEELSKKESKPKTEKNRGLKKLISARSVERRGIKRGRWTEEEDLILLKLIEKFGMRWALISQQMKTRNSQQIRDRYFNALDPSLSKKPFSVDEDITIYDLYFYLKNSWKDYRQYLPGRSANAIKNRYHSSVERKDLIMRLIKCL